MPNTLPTQDGGDLALLGIPPVPLAVTQTSCRSIPDSRALLKSICDNKDTKGLGEVLATIHVAMANYVNATEFSLRSAICDFVTNVSGSLHSFDPEAHGYRIMYNISVLLALHYLEFDIAVLVTQLRYLEECLNAQKTKNSIKRNKANKRYRRSQAPQLCRLFSTESVEFSLPPNVHLWDVDTGHQVRFSRIQWAALFADLSGSTSGTGSVPPGSPTAPEWCSKRNVSAQEVRAHGFKILDSGVYYGFRRTCPNGPYRLVFAARFTTWDELTESERCELTFWALWLILVTQQGSNCINNAAHNASAKQQKRGLFALNTKKNKHQANRPASAVHVIAARKRINAKRALSTEKREGILRMAGWRIRRQTKSANGETLGQYVPATAKDRKKPKDYIEMNENSGRISRFWLSFNQRLSPKVVASTCETLSALGVPMFGSHSTDFSTHTPFMGSSMSVSYNDKMGRQFANISHIDEDIDKNLAGKVFTSVAWAKVNIKTRQVVQDIEEVKAAMSDHLFIFPGYRFAVDLRAAIFINLMMRGGMDEHLTSQSSITDMESGIRGFGASVQTNRHIPHVIEKHHASTFRSYLDHLPKVFTEPTPDVD